MTTIDRIYTVERDGARLDKIAEAELGTWKDGIVDTLLAMNQGLSELPPIIPIGTKIKLPPRPANEAKRPVVKRVWGES